MSDIRRITANRAPGCKAGVIACAVAMLVLTGCVPAESTRYRGTMSRSVKPDKTASADVAGAFGLGESGGSMVNLAVVSE